MDEDESFDEFHAKLKDIVNSAFNLGEQIPVPKIVRKILRSLPERFHAKITTIEESKDLNSIPLTELIENLQTYELGFPRVGKGGKGKNYDNDELSNNVDTKLKSYITRQFKKFIEMRMSKMVIRITNGLLSLNISPKKRARENPRMLVKVTVFLLDQSVMGVMDLDI